MPSTKGCQLLPPEGTCHNQWFLTKKYGLIWTKCFMNVRTQMPSGYADEVVSRIIKLDINPFYWICILFHVKGILNPFFSLDLLDLKKWIQTEPKS